MVPPGSRRSCIGAPQRQKSSFNTIMSQNTSTFSGFCLAWPTTSAASAIQAWRGTMPAQSLPCIWMSLLYQHRLTGPAGLGWVGMLQHGMIFGIPALVVPRNQPRAYIWIKNNHLARSAFFWQLTGRIAAREEPVAWSGIICRSRKSRIQKRRHQPRQLIGFISNSLEIEFPSIIQDIHRSFVFRYHVPLPASVQDTVKQYCIQLFLH
jgi:hypothetical protein